AGPAAVTGVVHSRRARCGRELGGRNDVSALFLTTMNRLYRFMSTAGICAVSGTIAGAIVGGLFGLLEFVAQNQPMPRPLLLGFAIGLSLFAWVIVLTIVGVFGNYGAIAIAKQSLVTSAITGILTVFFVNLTR